MRFIFKRKAIELLYTEQKEAHLYPTEAINGFFRVMAIIRNAPDERDLRALRSLNYEALKGKRSHQHSLRLINNGVSLWNGIRMQKGNCCGLLTLRIITEAEDWK